MRYEVMISLRYLFSRKANRLISFMNLISIAGIAIGVACLIIVLAVMSGFGSELQKRIIGSNPHLIIDKELGIDKADYGLISEKLKAVKYVRGSYPFVWGQGMLRFRNRAQGVILRSVDSENGTDLSKIKEYMQEGDYSLGDDGVIIGSELSSSLGIFIGDELGVMTPASSKAKTFKVKGIFSSGMYEYDLNLVYMSVSSAASLFNMGQNISGIGVDIDNIYNCAKAQKEIKSMLAPSYYVRTWIDLNRNLFSALKLEKWAMFVILTLIVIVAALNIVSVLSVMVTEKTKDISILRAIGATRNSILAIFSIQGIMIGSFGVIAGLAGGMGLSLILAKYKFPILPGDIYYGIRYLPVRVNIIDSLVIAVAALLISLLASIYPARSASQMNPIDGLRYE